MNPEPSDSGENRFIPTRNRLPLNILQNFEKIIPLLGSRI